MELPNKAKAQVPFEKIVDYLLSETHSVGRSKAKYFRSYGFDEENAGLLAEGLLSIAQDSPIESSEQSSFGVKYILVGDIEAPNGDIIQIRTVWIIEGNLDFPRFVTAYPVE